MSSEALRLADELVEEAERRVCHVAMAPASLLKDSASLLRTQAARIAELERLCDATYVAQGADAYNHATDEMERFQRQRLEQGKEAGCEGSLCDGMAWLYGHIASLEAERDQLRAENASILQAITDPENQPSQYGTVTFDFLDQKFKAWEDRFHRMSGQYDQLLAEVERLRPNALRYEFLRETSQICGSMTGRGVAMPSYETTPQQRSYLDECIDRAIEAAKEAKR